jgi:hypothetical protein
MSSGMEAARYASATMLERAPVMTAKIAMIDHRRAARNVSVAAIEAAAAAPARAPGAKAPAVATKDANPDSHAEGKSDTHCDADRVYRGETRVGGKQPAPDEPRIVIRNEDHSWIHRRNGDYAGFSYRHGHLRRRN